MENRVALAQRKRIIARELFISRARFNWTIRWRERDKYGAETHEYEYEAMFAKGEHNATCLTDRSNAGRRAMLARGAMSGWCQRTKTLQVTPSSFGRGPG